MPTFTSLEAAREFFSRDLFAASNNMTLSALTKDGAVCTMKLTDRHLNAEGGVMGGAILGLVDFAFAVAANLNNLLALGEGAVHPAAHADLPAAAVRELEGHEVEGHRMIRAHDLQPLCRDGRFAGVEGMLVPLCLVPESLGHRAQNGYGDGREYQADEQ